MTHAEFGAQLLHLPDIFADKFFTIPDYQRGYAWEAKQVKELLKDVEHLMGDGAALRHYTGTLVLSRPQGVPAGEFHVVDGQQRLTTLFIFLQQLSQRLPQSEQAVFCAQYLWRGARGSERLVLRLNADTRRFFENILFGDESAEVSLESHQRLLDARNLIGKWLDTKLNEGVALNDVCNVLHKRLGFLVYAPTEDAETGIMFEVINNRGKPLSELEKVKNYLIYCCVKLSVHTLRESIGQDWSDILRALSMSGKTSSGDESAFLRYCLVVHFLINKTDSQNGYEEIKKRINLDASLADPELRDAVVTKIADFVSFMKVAAQWYQRLYAPSSVSLQGVREPGVVDVLDQIRAQARHASIMPLFLAIVIKNKGKGERMQKLLRLLEVLNFRVYMARNMTARHDTGQGDLYWYASRYFHGHLLDTISEEDRMAAGQDVMATEEDVLEFRLLGFAYAYAAPGRFQQSFTLESESPDDFYKWGGLRYFLRSYEANLQPNKTISIDKILLSVSDGKTADYLSVEHLWATKNRSGDGENNRRQDDFQRRRLGNFVLLELRLNIQGCNDDLEEKLPRYLQGVGEDAPTDLQQVRRMARDAHQTLEAFAGSGRRKTRNYYHDLHAQLNELQEARYMAFAEQRWSLAPFLGFQQINDDAQAVAASLES